MGEARRQDAALSYSLSSCNRCAPTAPATAAVDWHRALRDTEARLDAWIKRLTCTIPGREHPDAEAQDWDAVIAADLAARQTSDGQHPLA